MLCTDMYFLALNALHSIQMRNKASKMSTHFHNSIPICLLRGAVAAAAAGVKEANGETLTRHNNGTLLIIVLAEFEMRH